MTEEETKSLSAWRIEIQKIGKKHYLSFYQGMMGSAVSSPPRLYKAINLYGDWAVFEAILASSNMELVGDPLNYVLKVAHSKWKQMQQDEEEETQVAMQIDTLTK